jgi:ABC-2 type transport system ATP-binding protein
MLEAINLSKEYNGQIALQSLNLSVAAGEIYCLLGANGAGKTTTINLFLNFIQPTSGSARIDGMDVTQKPLETKRVLAYIPEQVMLYPNLTGIENLEYFTTLGGHRYAKPELTRFLEEAGLQTEAVGKRVAGYSKGMRQKVGIAIATAKQAKVLLLDEPTSGLDPAASNEFSGLLTSLSMQGVAVLMATHDLFRAKEVGTRIGIMSAGVLLAELDADEVTHNDLERTYLDVMRT